MSTKLRPLLTIGDVCDIVRVGPNTVRSWLKAGTIPSLRAGQLVRFDPDEIDAWLRSRGASNHRSTLPSGGER